MVDYKYSELYKQESIDKQMNIAFDGGNITNDDIHSEQFELTESLCSESQLRFGSCEASMIKFRISNIFTPLKDKWLTVTETLNHNTDIPFQFGKYKVHSDTPTADRRYRDVVAYDKMYDIINTDLTDWYNSLFQTDDTEVTLKEFRTSLMNYLVVEQEDVTLVNDNMIIKKTIQPTQLAGRDVVSAICEINGCFGHIGRDVKFHYVFLPKYTQGLYPSNNLYPSNDLYPRDSSANKIDTSLYIDCKYEDYLSQRITKLQIRQEENDIGTVYPGGADIEDDNTYIVQDNFLVYGKSASELDEIASNLFEIIKDTEYRPFNANVLGNPCFEVGDAIRFNTKYQIVESYVLNRTLKGVQGLRDSFSADGEEYYSEKVNAIDTQIQQLKGKTNTLERNVEETRSEIKDVEEGLQSEILQTAEVITSTMSATYETKDDASKTKQELSSQIKQTAEVITSTVSATYETKDDAGITKKELQSEIKQTAESITSTVASAQSKWDTTGYTIDFYGYGRPTISAKDNEGKYYLDQSRGILYAVRATGPHSYFWDVYAALQLITNKLSSRIEQTISSIELTVNNGDKTAGIVITLENEDGSTSEVAGTIEMTGMVTFNDLKGNGTTTINGSNITTGTIDARKVNVENINADNITSGTIDADKINVINVVAKSVAAGNITGTVFCLDDKEIIRSDESATEYGYEKNICLFGKDDLQNAMYGFLDCIVNGYSYSTILAKPYDPGEGYTKSTVSFLSLIDSHKDTSVPYLEISTHEGYAYGADVWESDTKLKKNIDKAEESAINKIRQIEFIQFDWKSNDVHVDLGVSANQIENIIPKAIINVKQPDNAVYDAIKNISNSVMTTYALKAIQEQQEIIESQQKEIDELKKSVSFLMQKIGGAYNE